MSFQIIGIEPIPAHLSKAVLPLHHDCLFFRYSEKVIILFDLFQLQLEISSVVLIGNGIVYLFRGKPLSIAFLFISTLRNDHSKYYYRNWSTGDDYHQQRWGTYLYYDNLPIAPLYPLINWGGIRESNSPRWFHKPRYYHYTNATIN